jgi:membrane protease YdiL (CAAX protease family)
MRATPKKARKLGHPWWLGGGVVYICMLSAMLLTGTLSSALGFGAAEGRLEVLIDDNRVLEASSLGGWDWTPAVIEGLDYPGSHLLTIRWITVNPTVGALYFDGLRFNENLIDDFERDPSIDRGGWSYFEEDPENSLILEQQATYVASGSSGWALRAVSTSSTWSYAQITKTFDLTGVENITLWVRGSWDYREVADVISHALTYAVALLLVYLHVTRLERRRFWGSVGIRRENFRSSIVWVFALSVVFTAILYFYWQGVYVLTGTDPQQEIRGFFGGSEDWYFAYLAFAFFFPVAFTEELVFRGFMIERFLAKGPFAAIGLSSLLFASLHLWYVSFGVVALSLYGGLFLVAVWWGTVYYKTRNILGLVIFHGLFNLWMVVEHFWFAQGRAVLESAIFVFGVVCLGYLVFLYLKGLFREIEELVKKK